MDEAGVSRHRKKEKGRNRHRWTWVILATVGGMVGTALLGRERKVTYMEEKNAGCQT